MTRIITTLLLSGLLLTAACHNKKKPETPADPLPTEPVMPQTPQQPAPIRGPAP